MPVPPATPAPPGTASRAVDVRGVTKTFGTGDSRTVALRDAHFEARENELHLVVGPSGCGKTTLLSVIAGTLAWDGGDVDVLGTRLNTLSQGEITRFRGRNIGFVFQQFNLIPTLNCIENISVPLVLAGTRRREAEERAAAMLREVGLAGRELRRPSLLSGGQQQRVAIARAIVHQPRLVICDEPTSALDSTTGRQVMDILTSLARSSGRCVIIVTHDHRTYRYADRITEMEDGRVRQVYAGEALASFIHENRH